MTEKVINKIIYFDKETIQNILQQENSGSKTYITDKKTSLSKEGELELSAKVALSVPLLDRIAFLFSGKLKAGYISKLDKKITITSTEISEFENLKPRLKKYDKKILSDIENSSTFFRVAGGYLRMFKGEIDEVDIKEFKSVMDEYEGYDTYKISETEYIRLNNTAFVSNYKRYDILRSEMTIYCIFVGEFPKEYFNFFEEINKMETLISNTSQPKKLREIYPSAYNIGKDNNSKNKQDYSEDMIKLYDVVYAGIKLENGENIDE